jgi:hypothetical protein
MANVDPLFVYDPSVLFGQGNMINFDTTPQSSLGNTLARLVVYGTILAAGYYKSYSVLSYGMAGLVAIAILFSRAPATIPMNTYYRAARPKLTSLAAAHHVRGRPNDLKSFRNALLNNVRERVIYLGEDIGIPRSIDYMMGGTRPLAPNTDEGLRMNKFFQNVHNQVHYEAPIPSQAMPGGSAKGIV